MTQQTMSDFAENRTIFVNGLSSSVGESELFKLVDDVTDGKSVQNVHINRDQARYETSIAYINMTTHEAAKTVIAKLNGKIIQNKKINMSWSMKDYKMRTQNDANLFVKNIKRDVNQQKFQEIFAEYGEVLSAKLSTNEKNESNGFGYVKYIDVAVVEQVLAAQEKIKEQIGEESFVICKFEKQPIASPTNLYIGNIDKKITEEEFVKYFETFGKIREDANGKKLYSYAFVEKYDKYRGFVNYENSDDAQKALTAPKDNVLGEGALVVAYYKTKMERRKEWSQKAHEVKTNCMNKYKDFNLYVNTKQPQTTEQEVRELLAECGQIYSLKVKYYSKEPTGIAYVCFMDAESAAKAIEKCKTHGWECQKLITKTERMTQNYQYNTMQPYSMYPLNYFQYLSLLPQIFYNQKFMRPPRDNRQRTDKKGGNKKINEHKKVEKKEEPVAKKEEKKAEPVVEKTPVEVTEEMKNDLGDKLYDYILGMKYNEDLTGRITGVLLESLEYNDLKKKIDDDQEALNKIIEEVKDTLASMNTQE